MGWNRFRKVAYVVLCGGVVIQATGCETLVLPILTNLLTTVLSSALMGGGVPF